MDDAKTIAMKHVLDYRDAGVDALLRKRKHNRILVWIIGSGLAIIVMIAFSLPLLLAARGTPSLQTRIQSEAMQLTMALETFHRENGRYPATLNGLVPGYLQQLPMTATWTYLPAADCSAFELTGAGGSAPVVLRSGGN